MESIPINPHNNIPNFVFVKQLIFQLPDSCIKVENTHFIELYVKDTYS